jgi:seryl-tRNA synthetase
MAKVTALQEAYQENKKLQSTIEQLQRRLNVVSMDTYKESQENNERLVEEVRQSRNKISELEKQIRQLNSELFHLSKQLEKKNETKTGRKPLDNNIVDRVHQLKMNKLSIRDIQRTLSIEGILISVGVIHKVIHGVK